MVTYLVREAGGAVDVGTYIKSALTSLLEEEEYQWVSAVEPSLAMAPAMTLGGPMVLALDGLDVADAVWQEGGRLGADADYASVSIEGIEGGPEGFDAPYPVYSRSAQRLFLIGGIQEETYTGGLWMRPIATGEEGEAWEEVSLEYTFHQVLAATYSPRDERLWVLDLDDAAVRLVRVHPRTGHHRVMHTWERSSGWDRQWLSVDQDGWVLLFSSNATSREHAIARLSISSDPPDGELVVDAFEERSRKLYYPPVVDMKGYTYVMGPLVGGSTDLVERMASVPGSPAEASDLDDVL